MGHLFDVERTVRTFRLHFGDEHADTLRDLLHSVARTLERVLPPEASRAVDREGSGLIRRPDGKLAVRRHPQLETALGELCRLGLFRTFASEEHGGFELPLAVYYLAVQLVSYYDTSLALVFLVHGNAMYVIQRYGSVAQRAAYLPRMVAGELLASVAFTEPTAGSDAGSIRTRARREGDSWVLAGDKLFITNGGDADLLVTTARTGPPEAGIAGVSTFLVEREVDGVEVVGLEDKTGLGGSPTAALSYPEVRIPVDRLLGPLNRGGEVMFAGVGMTRVNIGAQALGIAKRAFDAAVTFALERHQGGCLIVEHDAIQQRLADMALTISTMEHLICLDSSLEHRKEWHVREMSFAKYYCSEALQELTLRAVNVFGGYGVSRDHVVERCRREALALPLYGGTSEIQWYIIARELLDSVAGQAHVDYRARDAALAQELAARCATNARLAALAKRVTAVQEQLWQAVERVAADPDPTPFHRHLTELATALAGAQVLLLQASAPEADALEQELAAVAVDRLEDRAAVSCGRIDAGCHRRALKRAVRERLG
jgi:alkylation response protein AidB-like acyl-CoA dehydrogenase